MVAPTGIEPVTHGASNRCSTYWATEPWRSRRGSNPRSPPWQGGVLTTLPLDLWLRRQESNLWPLGYEPNELPLLYSAIKFIRYLKKYYKIKDNLAGNEGFEPPRAFTPLPVFKTSPFSHLGNCPFWWI